jgi:antitoxin PrlF
MAVNDNARRVIQVTQGGQATLPKEWRERLGIDAPGEVVMIAIDDGIIVKPVRSLDSLAGRHGDVFETGEALAKVRDWQDEERNHEREDEHLHGNVSNNERES